MYPWPCRAMHNAALDFDFEIRRDGDHGDGTRLITVVIKIKVGKILK